MCFHYFKKSPNFFKNLHSLSGSNGIYYNDFDIIILVVMNETRGDGLVTDLVRYLVEMPVIGMTKQFRVITFTIGVM